MPSGRRPGKDRLSWLVITQRYGRRRHRRLIVDCVTPLSPDSGVEISARIKISFPCLVKDNFACLLITYRYKQWFSGTSAPALFCGSGGDGKRLARRVEASHLPACA